jgi:hypothetical protein
MASVRGGILNIQSLNELTYEIENRSVASSDRRRLNP